MAELIREYAFYRLAAAFLLSACLAGCSHYSTTGRLPSHIRTIHIPTFENQTSEFSLPQAITDLVTERFLSGANLRLAEEGQSDAALNGTIRRYYEEAESYRQTQDIEVTGRRVTIVLDVEFLDRAENKSLWRDQNFSRYVVYDPDKETEQEAAQRVILLLADDLVTAVLQQW